MTLHLTLEQIISQKRMQMSSKSSPSKFEARADLMTDEIHAFSSMLCFDTITKRFSFSHPRIWNNHDLDDATPEQLCMLATYETEVTFSSQMFKYRKTYRNKNGFRVQDIFNAMADFESTDRMLYKWGGEVDTCHIFFEGVRRKSDGSYEINFGS